MQKPISKRDAYIKELRRIADYATELAGNKGVADNIFNDIGEAVCFMCSQPGAEAYACVHGELVAKGRIEQAKELDRFRAKTIKAYEDLINQGPPASYWVGPNGHPANPPIPGIHTAPIAEATEANAILAPVFLCFSRYEISLDISYISDCYTKSRKVIIKI